MPTPTYYRELLRAAFRGRRFLIFGGPHSIQLARGLVEAGAEPCFLLLSAEPPAAQRSPPGDAAIAGLHVVGGHEPPTGLAGVEAIWSFEAALRDLEPEILRAIEVWDPERRARAVGLFTLSPVHEVAGRARYADRPARWAELEDKTRLPGFLDAIGVRRGAVAVVRAGAEAIRAAASRLDRGDGVVVSGDTRPGIHGGAFGVRHVFDEATLDAAIGFFCAACDRVRVMPFLRGVPCSVHGIVFEDGEAIFRPMEMLVLRRPGCSRFLYAGTASFWDPAAREREELRSMARQVARGLARRVGFRGPFTLDGVLGVEGFVPTELNPRMGGAFAQLYERGPELPLERVALAAQAGERLDFRPAGLEALVLERADAGRSGSARLALEKPLREPLSCELVDGPGGVRRARPGELADGRLHAYATPQGGFLYFQPDLARTSIGSSFAPRAQRVLEFADRELGLGLGPLQAAGFE